MGVVSEQPASPLRAQAELELPTWLWLWLPFVPLVVRSGVYVADPEQHELWFNHKEGPVEWATVLVLLPAIAAGIYAFRQRARLPSRWLRRWVLLLTLACVYFAGEEISWGQSIWKWETPPAFEAVNGQNETNLHNASRWLNEKPRLVIELWILIAGIVLPLWGLRRGAKPLAVTKRWFRPTWVCFPTAVIAIVYRVPDRLEKFFIGTIETGFLADWRLSEHQELYIALFLMLYMLSLAGRLRLAACSAEGREPVRPDPTPT